MNVGGTQTLILWKVYNLSQPLRMSLGTVLWNAGSDTLSFLFEKNEEVCGIITYWQTSMTTGSQGVGMKRVRRRMKLTP